MAFLLGSIVFVALAASLGRPELYLASDPELARLIRGMAIIKGVFVLGGRLAYVALRDCKHPVRRVAT